MSSRKYGALPLYSFIQLEEINSFSILILDIVSDVKTPLTVRDGATTGKVVAALYLHI